MSDGTRSKENLALSLLLGIHIVVFQCEIYLQQASTNLQKVHCPKTI